MRVHVAIAPMKYLPTLVLAERFLTKYTALNGGVAPIAAWPHILNRFFHIVFRCRLSYGRTKFFVTAQNSISTWLFLSFISKNVLEAASQISANATPLTAESLMCEIPQFRVCDVVGHVHSNPQTYAYETNWEYIRNVMQAACLNLRWYLTSDNPLFVQLLVSRTERFEQHSTFDLINWVLDLTDNHLRRPLRTTAAIFLCGGVLTREISSKSCWETCFRNICFQADFRPITDRKPSIVHWKSSLRNISICSGASVYFPKWIHVLGMGLWIRSLQRIWWIRWIGSGWIIYRFSLVLV